MSIQVIPNKLSKQLKKLDNQVLDSEEALPHRSGLLWLLCGRKGSSKTSTMLNVLKTKAKDGGYKNYFSNIIIVSPTMLKDKKCDKLREAVEEDGNFYSDFNNKIMTEIMEKLASYAQDYKSDESSLLILDDCLALLPTSKKENKFHEFITQMRHYKCSCWIMLQFLKGASTLVRANVDMLSMWRSDSESEINSLIESFNVPRQIYEFATNEPYSFLHVTYTSGQPRYFKKFDLIQIC